MFKTNKGKEESNFFDPKNFSNETLLIISGIIVVLGIVGSFIFSQSVEKFFWDARTKSVFQIVTETTNNILQVGDISSWQDTVAGKRIEEFANDIENHVPNIVAIKIFTLDGVLAWTDLKNVEHGYKEPGIELELAEVAEEKKLIKKAGEGAKLQLKKDNLLEIWTVINDSRDAPFGYIEIYFDSSDVTTFVSKIQYSILIATILVLSTIIILIRLAFRKQDELVIRQALELGGIINMSPIGIYTIDRGGIIETYNPAMVRISGIKDASETIGKNVFDAEAYKSTGLAKLLAESTEGAPFETEVEIESSLADHKKTWRHYYGVPIKNTGGGVEHVLVMVQDVTEQKILEEQVREYSSNLEKKIAERTNELETKLSELERFQKLTVDRELRMIELKKQLEEMRAKLESMGIKVEIK